MLLMNEEKTLNWLCSNSKLTRDTLPSIDVRYLKQNNLLHPGLSGKLLWRTSNTEIHSIGITVYKFGLDLQTRKLEHIRLSETICNYGGVRRWLICPACHRRVVAVYGFGDFKCRHCLHLTYASCNESKTTRILMKNREILERLDKINYGLNTKFTKPKGMHAITFLKLKSTLIENYRLVIEYIYK